MMKCSLEGFVKLIKILTVLLEEAQKNEMSLEKRKEKLHSLDSINRVVLRISVRGDLRASRKYIYDILMTLRNANVLDVEKVRNKKVILPGKNFGRFYNAVKVIKEAFEYRRTPP